MNKTSISYIKGKTINLEIDVEFASIFQNFLLYFITTAEDPNHVIEGYKKFEAVVNNDPDVQLTEFQSYLYCLTALCQNIKNSALEQGAAKEIEIPEEVAEQSKNVAQMILKGKNANQEELAEQYKDLLNKINKLS
jgi:hypothetical protein